MSFERFAGSVVEVEVSDRNLFGQAGRADRRVGDRGNGDRGGGDIHDCFLDAESARATIDEREHGEGDDQRAGPGELLPVLVGRERELEDDDRQARHRGVEVGAPELVVERGEQQRRGLAADAGDREQHAGDHAGFGGAVAHLGDHERARHAERGRGLAQLVRHQDQHVLGGAHHDRDDDHRQRDGARQSRRNGPSGPP